MAPCHWTSCTCSDQSRLTPGTPHPSKGCISVAVEPIQVSPKRGGVVRGGRNYIVCVSSLSPSLPLSLSPSLPLSLSPSLPLSLSPSLPLSLSPSLPLSLSPSLPLSLSPSLPSTHRRWGDGVPRPSCSNSCSGWQIM